METRANNILVGFFVLALMLTGFLIVYWISRVDNTGGTKQYQVVFTGTITGLARGSTVLFNGIRVGEVTRVDLVPEDPSRASAIITVDRITPVKPDTRSQLEYIGLTGIAAIQLSGGTAGSPNIEELWKEGTPILYAERSQFQDLVEAGRKLASRADSVLEKMERLVGDIEASVRQTILNLEKFASVLGNNSKSVDVLLSEAATLGGKLNTLADRLNSLLGDAGALAGGKETSGLFAELTAAARAVRLLAERLDKRTAEISAGVQKFSGQGLREYEALAADGRRTLTDLNRLLRRLEKDPSQVIFGGNDASGIPEYRPDR